MDWLINEEVNVKHFGLSLTKSLYMRTRNYYVVNTHYHPVCF